MHNLPAFGKIRMQNIKLYLNAFSLEKEKTLNLGVSIWLERA
jgi:hypothetical protein